MNNSNHHLPLFVLLAKKEDLPKEKFIPKEHTKNVDSASKSIETEKGYSLYKNVSTFG